MGKTFFGFALLFASFFASAQRQMENLSRGVVAIRNPEGKVFVSWRLLGNESPTTAFNLYRSIDNGKALKLNKAPLTKGTNFIDDLVNSTSQRTYFIKTISKGSEGEASKPFTLKPSAKYYLSIPLQTPAGYTLTKPSANKSSASLSKK